MWKAECGLAFTVDSGGKITLGFDVMFVANLERIAEL